MMDCYRYTWIYILSLQQGRRLCLDLSKVQQVFHLEEINNKHVLLPEHVSGLKEQPVIIYTF